LTPEQETEARRFAEVRIAAQFSTESVDEPETEALLKQAYQVAGLPPPEHIHWPDGPLQLMRVVWARHNGETNAHQQIDTRVWGRAQASVQASVTERLYKRLQANVWDRVEASVWYGVAERVRESLEASLMECVQGYEAAPVLAFYRFFDEYLLPNELHALAHFNERVSGYWLGSDTALLGRRPRVLACDEAGRLHSATGRCLEHHDGWGFYAWHRILVPEHVILAPERLSGEDFLNEPNVEVRRVI